MREFPAFDPGPLDGGVSRPFFLSILGRNLSISLLAKHLAAMIGEPLSRSVSAYHATLYDWSERTLCQMQRRFDAYATSYRAQVERIVGDNTSLAGLGSTIERDLESLEGAHPEQIAAP